MPLKTRTFRFKILLVVIVVVVSMTATIQVVVQREINKAMLAVNEENALNLLDAVVMHVESEYKSILFHEQNTLENRQRELRNVVSIGLYCLDLYYQQYQLGALTEEEAKQRAKETLSGLRYDDGVGYLWVNDMGRPVPRMVMHPTMPELDGMVLDDEAFYCALGATQNLFVASVDVCEASGAGYVDYLWPKPTATGLTEDQPKISYVARFEPWNWVVGTGVYIDDIEEETRKRFEAVLAELRNAFSHIRIADTGYLFIFSEDKQMLVHPVVDTEVDTQDLLNPESGNNILDELVQAAETPARPFVYRWNKPEHPGEYRFLKKTYVRYFPPLNWYIAASFYNREIEQPARLLQAKILLFSLGVLLVAVVLAVIASSSLLRPLKRLTRAAKAIGAGKTEAYVPVSGTVETMELGQILNDMIESLKASEKDLKRANSYIENIINSMPSILVGVDADGRITQWNDGAQQATGTSSSEALGQSVEQVLPHINAEMERIREALKQRTVQSHIKCAYKEQGETRYEDVTIYPLVTNGVEGVVVRIDDVTERVRVEEMMVQSEKMLSVGGLAAGMAHEINNPLAGMMQTADVMTNRLTGRLAANERAAEEAGTTMEAIHRFMDARGIPNMLHNIRESGRRAAEIVQNMLSFARKSNAAVSSHNLVELLDQILELAATDYDLKKQYDFKRIDIRKDYEELLPMVPCEGAKIQQVVLNLVRNAAEAMQEAGTEQPILTVKAYQDQEREMVCLEVQDNGPGMDEETQKRVFDPFFTTKPAGEGTGLGLSVSYFIITENHHGEMEVESQLGVGTRFVIRIPLRSPAS